MSNSRFGFDLAFSAGTVKVFGVSSTWVNPTGIPTIASKASGCWCNSGNVSLRYLVGTTPYWVEGSVTYVNKTSSQGCPNGVNVPSTGWYFATRWSGATDSTYYALSTDPTSHTITIKLYYDSVQGAWFCSYSDASDGAITGKQITGAPAPGSNGCYDALLFFENGGDTNCCDYSTFGGITFTNVTFFNSTGSVISPTYSKSQYNSNIPAHNCANTSSTCINENTTNLQLSYNG